MAELQGTVNEARQRLENPVKFMNFMDGIFL